MISICFVTCWYKGISVANYVHGLLEGLKNYPFVNLKIVSSNCRCYERVCHANCGEILEDKNCEFVKFPPYFYSYPKNRISWVMNEFFQSLLNIFRGMIFLSKSKACDIIHYHQGSGFSFGIFPLVPIVLVPTSNKKVITIHFLHIGLFPWLARLIYNKTDSVLVYSERVKSELAAIGVNPYRVRVIPHGVAIPPLSSTTRNEIAFFGAPTDRKGAFVLLEALKILKERGKNTKVHFYGICSNSEKEAFLTKVQELTVADHVIWGGRLSENDFNVKMQSCMFTFAVYRVPVSGSSVFTRAMANGTPIIATNILRMPEFLQTSAILIPPDDPEALADAISRLENDPRLVENMSKVARERAYDVSWSNVSRQILEVYLNVLKGKC